MTTVNVIVKAIDQNGAPIVGAVVTAKLNNLEVQASVGYVISEKVSGICDSNGEVILSLWPNELGSTESMYTFTIKNPATGLINTVIATIPNNDCALHSVANLPAYPGKSDGQLAIDEAIAAVAPALAAKIVAQAAAVTATTQAGIATAAANTIGSAVTDAAAFATAAGISAINANTAKLAAEAASVIASNKESIVSGLATTINSQASQVSTDSTQVATDLATITSLASQVTTDKDTVTTKAGEVATNTSSVAANKAIVDTKTGEVSANATAVATNKDIVEASKLVVTTAESNVVSLASTVAINAATSTTKASEASASQIAAAASETAAALSAAVTSSFNVTIGTVSEGAASATMSGTAPNRILNLVIPKGDPGTGSLNTVTGTAPVDVTPGVDPVVSMLSSSSTRDGYLTKEDWSLFNNKVPFSALATVALTGNYSNLSNKPTTGDITESGNLYFTDSRVRNAVLTGLSLSDGSDVTATDTILVATGKLQKQIDNLPSGLALGTSVPTTTAATGNAGTATVASKEDHVHPHPSALQQGASIPGALQSVGTSLTAAGTTQATALAITKDINYISTAAANTGVVLPVVVLGKTVTIINRGANAIKVYPAVGEFIDTLVVNTSISLPVNGVLELFGGLLTKWASTNNCIVSASLLQGVVLGVNGGMGVSNSGKTLTLGGNHVNSGAFASTFTFTGTTTVTFPTSGILAVLGANTYTGDQTFGNNNLLGIKTAGFNGEFNAGNSGTSITINWANGQNQVVTLTGTCTITFTNPVNGHLQLRIIQDATGNRAVTFASLSASRWLGSATAPALNTAANSETFLNLSYGSGLYTQSLTKVGA